jgi:hypothetical protein
MAYACGFGPRTLFGTRVFVDGRSKLKIAMHALCLSRV